MNRVAPSAEVAWSVLLVELHRSIWSRICSPDRGPCVEPPPPIYRSRDERYSNRRDTAGAIHAASSTYARGLICISATSTRACWLSEYRSRLLPFQLPSLREGCCPRATVSVVKTDTMPSGPPLRRLHGGYNLLSPDLQLCCLGRFANLCADFRHPG